MKYLVDLELIVGYGSCTGCFFEGQDECPCGECENYKIFIITNLEEVHALQA